MERGRPLIELAGVGQAFFANRQATQAKVALKDVNLSIEQGEFVSLVGPSGCGKTVTLSIMAGFVRPVCGQALFRGRPIEGPSPERGVVFQEYSLMPWLSVEDNIMFALRNAARAQRVPFDKQAARERAREALSQVGLADAAPLRPNTLSGGMKQRVAIARLLAMDSEVLLMEEPFSALDEQTRAVLDASLFQLWRERAKTIVFVTHNITEAVLMSSRIVMFSGTPGSVVQEWHVPASFDRSPDSADVRSLVAHVRELLPQTLTE